jgi:hypothetical protein
MDYSTLNTTVAQIAPEMGDHEASLEKVRIFYRKVYEERAKLEAFPNI